MSRPISSEESFPCGHPRTPINTYRRAHPDSPVCLTCRRASVRAYYLEHRQYFADYRARLKKAGYWKAYAKAYRADEKLPSVRDYLA